MQFPNVKFKLKDQIQRISVVYFDYQKDHLHSTFQAAYMLPQHMCYQCFKWYKLRYWMIICTLLLTGFDKVKHGTF